jgi:hypothetical protein
MGKLKLPDAPETLAFRAVVRVLKTDPTLRGVGLKLRAWEDSDKDLVKPTLDEMPCLILTPNLQASGWWSESQQRTDLLVDLELWMAGTNADDALNLFGAIRGAFWPTSDPARRAVVAAIMDAVCLNGQIQSSSFEPATVNNSARALVARGAIHLINLVDT